MVDATQNTFRAHHIYASAMHFSMFGEMTNGIAESAAASKSIDWNRAAALCWCCCNRRRRGLCVVFDLSMNYDGLMCVPIVRGVLPDNAHNLCNWIQTARTPRECQRYIHSNNIIHLVDISRSMQMQSPATHNTVFKAHIHKHTYNIKLKRPPCKGIRRGVHF